MDGRGWASWTWAQDRLSRLVGGLLGRVPGAENHSRGLAARRPGEGSGRTKRRVALEPASQQHEALLHLPHHSPTPTLHSHQLLSVVCTCTTPTELASTCTLLSIRRVGHRRTASLRLNQLLLRKGNPPSSAVSDRGLDNYGLGAATSHHRCHRDCSASEIASTRKSNKNVPRELRVLK